MNRIARLLLKVVTGISPVFIAACYGMEATWSQRGRAIDRDTRAGIQGIKVTCMIGGSQQTTTSTYYDGSWSLYLDYDGCDQITFEDIDGDLNGGTYRPREIVPPSDGSDIDVELTREP